LVRDIKRTDIAPEVLVVLDASERMFDPPEKWGVVLDAVRQLTAMPGVRERARIWVHPSGEQFETGDPAALAAQLDALAKVGGKHGKYNFDLSETLVVASKTLHSSNVVILVITDGGGRFYRKHDVERALSASGGRLFAFFPNVPSRFRMESATPVVTDNTCCLIVRGPLGERSVKYDDSFKARELLPVIESTGGDSYVVFAWMGDVRADLGAEERSVLKSSRISQGLTELYDEMLHPYVATVDLLPAQTQAVKISVLSAEGRRLNAHYPRNLTGCGTAARQP